MKKAILFTAITVLAMIGGLVIMNDSQEPKQTLTISSSSS